MKNTKQINTLKLLVTVINPETTLFEGEADSVTSASNMGKFDILPMHINFISIIKDFVTIRNKNSQVKDFKIDGGVLKVYDNHVDIFLGIEVFKEEHEQLK